MNVAAKGGSFIHTPNSDSFCQSYDQLNLSTISQPNQTSPNPNGKPEKARPGVAWISQRLVSRRDLSDALLAQIVSSRLSTCLFERLRTEQHVGYVVDASAMYDKCTQMCIPHLHSYLQTYDHT